MDGDHSILNYAILSIIVVMIGTTWIMLARLDADSNKIINSTNVLQKQAISVSVENNRLLLSGQILSLHDQHSHIDQSLLEIQDAVQCLQAGNTSVSCSHIHK